MEVWLAARGDRAGSLFLRAGRTERVHDQGITAQAIYSALRRRAKQAGVKAFSPHDLRRSFVGDLLDAGADISSVQQLAGHSSVTTTQRYDRRGERAKAKAAELLHVPFVEVERAT